MTAPAQTFNEGRSLVCVVVREEACRVTVGDPVRVSRGAQALDLVVLMSHACGSLRVLTLGSLG